MGREEIEHLGGGVVRRKTKRVLGLFIDGVGLDRATRRLDRKVDLSRLVSGLVSGIKLETARYYTLIPYEDDARQFAFLDAVERAGLEVVLKRLPPKGVKRQVSMDVHMATDIVSYSLGQLAKADRVEAQIAVGAENHTPLIHSPVDVALTTGVGAVKRSVVVVCPSRELSYAVYAANQAGVETSLADFGLYGTSDGWRGVDHWIDLSTSETIWR